MLIKSNYELDRPNNNGDTAIHIAAQKGNTRHLKELIKAGANYDYLNKHSLSPLYLAILNKKMDCVEALLEAGASPFFDGNNKEMDRSPVYLAIRQEYIEVVK